MASKGGGGTEFKLTWKILSPSGPTLSNHIGCLINDVMYIHGGIDKHGSTTPLCRMYKMDLSQGIWNEVRAENSPALSHHACVVMENRYIFVVGGWDGSRRSCKAHVFDTQEEKWRPIATSGFPEGAGFSSHTASLLANGDVLLIGREGSLRLQRRSGQAYLLIGDLKKGVYEYRQNAMHVDSRSGHTSHILGQVLSVIGGRNDKLVELHQGFKGAYQSAKPNNTVIQKVWSICKHLQPMLRPPGGRKQHVALEGGGGVLVHGGETFDGRMREPVSEMFMFALKPSIQWYKLGDSGIGRAGHVICASADHVIIHGGYTGKKDTVMSDCYTLEVSEVRTAESGKGPSTVKSGKLL